MKRVLVTGVAGFIGAHVARRFAAEGFEVVGIDDLSTGKLANVPSDLHFVQGDLARAETMAALPGRFDLILHLAGQSSGEVSFDDPVADLQKNAVSTLNLIRFGARTGCGRLVYASSMSVYGSVPDMPIDEQRQPTPLSCYGVGKLASEGYLRIYRDQLPFVAMRMFNVYGPGQDLSNLRQGMVSIYMAQALASGRIVVKGGTERFRDFIYIDDVVEAWWRAGTRDGAANQALNVGTGRRTSVGELLQAVTACVPGSTYVIEGSTPGDQAGIYADVTKLARTLDISRFTPLDQGLRHFVDWARQSAPAPSPETSR